MTILTDAELLERIESFCKRHDVKPTRFGRDALGEGSLIDSLQKGRSLSLKTANRVLAYMADIDGLNDDAAPRPASAQEAA